MDTRSMTRPISIIIVAWAGVLILAPSIAGAAEFRLRSQCRARGAMVTLGDVAEILATDARQIEILSAMELFPAPSGSRQRFVQIREIQDLLLGQGVPLTEHRFSGSSRVTVLGNAPVSVVQQRALSPSDAKRAEQRVCQAVLHHLQQSGAISAGQHWNVRPQLDTEQMRLAANPKHQISVAGGTPPWTGPQRFEATVATGTEPVRFPLDVEVSAPPAAVVAARLLPRGTVVRASDVKLASDLSPEKSVLGFSKIEEVVGREITQAVSGLRGVVEEGRRAYRERRDELTAEAEQMDSEHVPQAAPSDEGSGRNDSPEAS